MDSTHQVPASAGPSRLIQGRYEIREELLRCRFSTLFNGFDTETWTPLVIRHLHTTRQVRPEARDEARLQFLREGHLMRRLTHRNLPRVLDLLDDDGEFYIVMEPFEGFTLDYVVQHLSGPPTEPLLSRWMEQIAAALEYLHGQQPQIIYRDLRPQTVLITSYAVIKLVDFGLARLLAESERGQTLFRGMGALHYAAPEQLGSTRSDPRMDLYALGATFYFLSTGTQPPSAMDRMSDKGELASICAVNPMISPEFEAIVFQLMMLDPNVRPQDAATLRSWLKELAILRGETPNPTITPAETPVQPAAPTLSLDAWHAQAAQAQAPRTPASPHVAPAAGLESPPVAGWPAAGIAPAGHVPPPPLGSPPTLAPPAPPPLATPPAQATMPPASGSQPPPQEPTAPPLSGPAEERPVVLDPALMDEPPPRPAVKPPPPAPEKKSLLGIRLPWFGGAKASAPPPDEAAVAAKAKSDEAALAAFPFLDLALLELSRETGLTIPETISKRIQGVCIGKPSAKEITLAVKDPSQVYIYDHINYATQGKYKPVLMRADPLIIDLAHEFIYKVSSRLHHVGWLEWLEKKRYQSAGVSVIQAEEKMALPGDEVRGPAIEAVDRMIKEAISIRASDIHIESYENEVALRYRIDGILHVMDTWPRREAGAYVKRVKILANMDIAQDRVTQGGRISVRVADKEYDLRVSCVPVPDGESIVMRLLSKGTFTLKLEDLGFSPRNLVIYRKMVEQPHGMLLISGPTGSGKSTTLYATLAEINRPDRKILTVEDPIEYKMNGVVQVQVNMAPREEEKKVTFARALREFLRQDPDVILVGEIRDDETAAISTQAALTGHLLLSTIHTNDAATIVTRLRDRGIEPFLLSSTLLGGIAQRLVRTICDGCKEEIPVPDNLRHIFTAEGIHEPHMFHGPGCTKCHRTGYRGRMAIHEVLNIDAPLRELVARNADAGELARCAEQNGMKTLYQDGILKVNQGLVPMEEVQRVCMTM